MRPSRTTWYGLTRVCAPTTICLMDRRRFVLGLAAPLAAPVLLNAQRKSGSGLPITGAGEHAMR